MSATSGQDEDSRRAVYRWGAFNDEFAFQPTLSGQMVLACRRVTQLACSGHFLAVTDEGSGIDCVWAWGDNTSGQCGLGAAATETRNGRAVPVALIGQPTAVLRRGRIAQIGCSQGVSVVAPRSGDLLIAGTTPWDHRTSLDFRQLLLGSFGSVQQFALGRSHVLALVENHFADAASPWSVLSWGCNTHGQLGHADVALDAVVPQPRRLAYAFPSPVVHVASGYEHCLAVTAGGQVFAWGKNVHLSIADTADEADKPRLLGTDDAAAVVRSPSRVTGLKLAAVKASCTPATLRGRLRVACTESATFLLLDGKLWSWGESDYCALGHGSDVRNVLHPTPVSSSPSVHGQFVDVACGHRHTLLLSDKGHVYALGYGRFGALGLGDQVMRCSRLDCVRSPSGEAVVARLVAAGGDQSAACMRLVPRADLIGLFQVQTPQRSVFDYGEQVPAVFTQTVDYLEANALCLETEGIYRVDGAHHSKSLVTDLWLTGEPLASFVGRLGVPELTHAIKTFLLCHQPLLTYDLFDDFVAAATAAAQDTDAERVYRLGAVLRRLPAANLELVRRFYQHGVTVMAYESKNRMGVVAVSRLFGRLTLRPRHETHESASVVEQVARPLLTHAPVFFRDWLWCLFARLYADLGGALALEVCEALARDPFRDADQERHWFDVLQRDYDAHDPDLPALYAALASIRQRFTVLNSNDNDNDNDDDDVGGVHACFELIDALGELEFGPHIHPCAYVVQSSLRAQKLNNWNVPLQRSRRTAADTAAPPHRIISSVNSASLGSDDHSMLVRQLQELAVRESVLCEEIRERERALDELWANDIDPLLAQLRDHSHLRHARLEHLLFEELWPRYVTSAPLTEFFNECGALNRAVQERIAADLRRLSDSGRHDPALLRAIAERAERASSLLDCTYMSGVLKKLQDIDSPFLVGGWVPPSTPAIRRMSSIYLPSSALPPLSTDSLATASAPPLPSCPPPAAPALPSRPPPTAPPSAIVGHR